jgi:hypothetical protein
MIESIYDTGNLDSLRLVASYLEGFAQGPHMEITNVKGWSQTNILNTALLAALRWLAGLSPADRILSATLLESLLASSTDVPWAIEGARSHPHHIATNIHVTIHRSRIYKTHISIEHWETIQYLTEKDDGRGASLYDLVDFWKLEDAARIQKILGPTADSQNGRLSSRPGIGRQNQNLGRSHFRLAIAAGIVWLPRYARQCIGKYLAPHGSGHDELHWGCRFQEVPKVVETVIDSPT